MNIILIKSNKIAAIPIAYAKCLNILRNVKAKT